MHYFTNTKHFISSDHFSVVGKYMNYHAMQTDIEATTTYFAIITYMKYKSLKV